MARREQPFCTQGCTTCKVEQTRGAFAHARIFVLIVSIYHLQNLFAYLCLYSAVDQFRKQFSHLEENSGNGPVIPMERKHASLPR